MDSLLTPLPGKANDSTPKINQNTNQATKMGTGEAQNFGFRHNRVFGTTRSTNIIPVKPVWDKSITKAKIAVSQRQPKSIRTTLLPNDTSPKTNDKKSTENVNSGLNYKSDTFPERVVEKTSKNMGSASVPRTPVASSSHLRTKSSTPFFTALNCSKCRFDKLETSTYWVGQIKIAESVGKHFVASEFFRLALESHAEPIRNLRMELKRYLLRHGNLSEQKEWREVAARYGLLKVESNTGGMDSITDQSEN